MRHIAPSDLSTAARALLALPAPARAAEAARLVSETEAADRYRKRVGRSHPLWGNGTLEGAARGRVLAEPRSLSDTDYLSCLAVVLDAILVHRGRIHSGT
ncbi:MAG: hypothetical protein MUE98_01370 [Rhodobacteraceae bacterium]|jgi:hypothetical protein|nr:hypothetical protein [Paracoccaceae bacterium]